MDATLPLDGITVIAIEQAVAAPFCTSRLADAGARVIKVERPEGDFARGYDDAAPGGQSSYFVWLNRGKESVVLNLADASDRDQLQALIGEADILVQNLKPGALAKLGLAVASLREAYPELIVCSISGYGETGPMADRKAYDLLVQAEAGLCSITGGPDAPARVGISVVDIATGATAHAAILEALLRRARTRRGVHIQIAMFDVIADWLTVPLLQQEAGRPPARIGLAHPSIAPYGVFETCDGRQILLSIQSDREWAALAKHVLRDTAMIHDPRFATNLLRVANRAQTDALVSSTLAKMTVGEARSQLEAAGIAFADVNGMADLASHPHLRRITVETEAGPISVPAPASIVDGELRRYGGVPALPVRKSATL